MRFDLVMLAYPLVLALHNAEEYQRSDAFTAHYHGRLPQRFTARPVLLASFIVLTVAAALAVALALLVQSALLLQSLRIAVFALLANGLGHCALSAYRRAIMPGTLTAVFLVIPFSAVAILLMRSDLGDSPTALFRTAALGALAMPVLAACALLGGYACTQAGLYSRERSA